MFREKIRKAIMERNLRVDSVAEKADMPKASLYSYIKGTRNCNIKQLDRLIHVLGLTLKEKPGFTFDPEKVPNF